MKKTSLVVLNLTLAGTLEIEIASAQEAVPGTNDDPRARASPAESRLRLGLEQTVASFQHHSYKDIDAGDSAFAWGFGELDLAADFRAVDRLEVGLAVGLSGNHWSNTSVDEFGTHEGSSTDAWLRLGPRIGYAIPLASSLALVPRIGVEYTHGTRHHSNQSLGITSEQSFTNDFLDFGSGVMLEVRPVSWLFVAPLVSFKYRVHTNYDGDTAWFSDQSFQVWWLDAGIAAGARI